MMLLYKDFGPTVYLFLMNGKIDEYLILKHSQTKFMAHWGNQKCFASSYELFWNVIQSNNVCSGERI